jgi:hypothetical protein
MWWRHNACWKRCGCFRAWGKLEQRQTHLDSFESGFPASLEVGMSKLPDLRAASEPRPIRQAGTSNSRSP